VQDTTPSPSPSGRAGDVMSADPMEVLAAAVRAGDAAGARAALAAHPVLKNRLDEAMPGGSFGATALLTAVHRGDREMAELLLDAGADIDARSHWWAGSFGVLDGESPLVPWLIERGARVDAYAAARHGMLDRLSGLIEADPTRVGQRGGDGQTPLHVARTVAIAAYLLDHGADIDALDVDHESTPAMYLVSEHPDVARFLVSRGCRTDILLASALGDLPAVRKHLEQDPASIERSVSEEDFPKRNPRAGGTIYFWTLGYHKTPQMLAREFEHEEVFRYLMERTPALLKLALACEWGDVAEVERLLAEQPGLAGGLPDRMAKRLVSAARRKTDQYAAEHGRADRCRTSALYVAFNLHSDAERARSEGWRWMEHFFGQPKEKLAHFFTLFGTSAECVRVLKDYAAAGLTTIIARIASDDPRDQSRILLDEVKPQLS